MSRVRATLAMAIVAASFAAFPACVLGGGSREPRGDVTVPRHGPLIARGGQHLTAPMPADAAERARAALVSRGWIVVASTRAHEALGVIHDNVAIIRWSARGWWARVDQRSEFGPEHLRVPPWDHPWEALRLLHCCAPGSGAADGWTAWPVGHAFSLYDAVAHRWDPYTCFDGAAVDIGSPPMLQRGPSPSPSSLGTPSADSP